MPPAAKKQLFEPLAALHAAAQLYPGFIRLSPLDVRELIHPVLVRRVRRGAREGTKVWIVARKASWSRIILYKKGSGRVRLKFTRHTRLKQEERHTCGVVRGVY
jgi:hypothetical protein